MQLHKASVLLALAAIVVLGTAAQDEPLKIAVVDIDQAISSTEEGRAAREELARKHGVMATRIAHGVPLGGELEFIDSGTLSHAFNGRKEF